MNKNGTTIKNARYGKTFKITSDIINVNEVNLIQALDMAYPEIIIDVEEVGAEDETIS